MVEVRDVVQPLVTQARAKGLPKEGGLDFLSCKLQLMLRKASQALYVNEQFNLEEMHNYRMAVTEREVINGCLSVDNVKDHVIIYTRILKNINLQNLKRASAFIDIMDRHVEELRRGKAKDNMIIILLLGSLAGCALVFLSVKSLVT